MSRATPAPSPTRSSSTRSAGSPTRSRSSASGRVTASTSTWAWCPSSRWRCSRAHASVRRTRSCSAGSPSTRCATGSTTRRRRSSSPPTARGAAGNVFPLKETADTAVAECPSIEKVLVLRRTESDVPWTDGRDVWWHDLVPRPEHRLPAGADGRRGPPLPPLHVGHDGEAQGDHAHDRGLPHPGRVHAPQRLRPPARLRRVLVRGRRRLGDRPLVHRLRTAHEPDDERACTRARRTSRTRTASGGSSSVTASRSCTPRRRRSGRS